MGSVENGWYFVKKYISEQDTYEYNRGNKENDSYRPWTICPGYTVVTEPALVLMLSKGDRKPQILLNPKIKALSYYLIA